MLLLILLIILILGIPAGGFYSGYAPYRTGGFGIGAVLVIILIYLLLTNSHYIRL